MNKPILILQTESMLKTEVEMRMLQSDKMVVEMALQKMLKDILENPKK